MKTRRMAAVLLAFLALAAAPRAEIALDGDQTGYFGSGHDAGAPPSAPAADVE